MKLENLKKFNTDSCGIAYDCNDLTSKQYNDIYLQACEQYNSVSQNHISWSIYRDIIKGYILCK